MLKISKPLGAEKVSEYYKVEFIPADMRYYSEARAELTGEWHGKLAEKWGLVGGVSEEHYARMADGKNPHTGDQLIKHRPQTDPRPWINSDAQWKEHLNSMAMESAMNGAVLRTVPPSERRVNAPAPKLPGVGAETVVRTERENALVEMHKIAAQVYAENLKTNVGAQLYLHIRGISRESAREFGIGASQSGDQLVEKLKHFGPELMSASGLFVGDERRGFHDSFRGKLMIPIQDRIGDTVAFAARIERFGDYKSPEPKYVNSPSTEIYDKSEILFNAHRARAEESGRLVIVEGQLDAIAAYGAGVRDVIGLSGSALSKSQINEIKSMASDVVVNLDGDAPGRAAAIKHTAALTSDGLRVRALDLNTDPDEYVQTEGTEAYRTKVDQVAPLVEWLGARAREMFSDDAYGKTDALRWVVDQLSAIAPEERSRISKEVSTYLEVKVETPDPKKHVEHIAAWDFTFAPHKSYSATALVGGDTQMVKDHNEAVRVALDAGEEYTQARGGGDKRPINTANWAAALFLHDTARPVDGQPPNPHLHTHSVVFNMTDAEGKIRSIKALEWYKTQSYQSVIYQSEMAFRARERGYELTGGRNFSTAIKGYSPEYLEAMSARSNAIEEEKEKGNLIGAEADERINKRIREPKQVWDADALREVHKKQALEFGEHPEQIVEAAKHRLVQRLSEADRLELAHEAIDYARDRLQEGQAVNDEFELVRDALRFGLGRIRLEDVKRAFGERLVEREREFIKVDHYRQDAPGARYTTSAARTAELETIREILKGQGATQPITPSLTKDEFRTKYKERIVNGKEMTMSNSQMHMAYNVLTSGNQVAVVRGAAGTGKTEAMRPIAELARMDGQYHVVGLGPTGGAANNMSDLGIESGTLQGHLFRGIHADAKKRLYLLDEGSLVGARQLHRFIKTLRPQDRVAIVYDPRQHQAVEAGRIVEELEQAGVETFRLENIIRQRDSPDLLEVINEFKDGRTLAGLRKLDDQNRVLEIPNRKTRLEVMAGYYAEHDDHKMVAPDNRTLGEMNIAARNALRECEKLGVLDVEEANVLIGVRDVREADRKRAVFYEPGNIVRWGKAIAALGIHSGQYTEVIRSDSETNKVTVMVGNREVTYDPKQAYGVEIFEAGKRKLAVGERLQVTRPWKLSKDRTIANRAAVTVVSLDGKGKGVLQLADGKKVDWDIKQMPHVEYAYAMTSYSLQYATGEGALLHLDMGDSRVRTLLDKALVYVGASRGKNQILIFTDDKETLLSDNSPVNRIALKPKALGREEIEEVGERARQKVS